MNAFFRSVFAIAAKDILMEFRRKSLLFSLLVFALLLFFIADLAMGGLRKMEAGIGAGVLWTILFFVTTIGLIRADRMETEHKGWQGMILTPQDRSVLYYGKFTGNLFFALLVHLAAVCFYFFLFDMDLPRSIPLFSITLFIGSAGMTALGTFLSILAMSNPMAEVLVPLLLFPLSVPLLLAVSKLTHAAMGGADPGTVDVWLFLSGAFDLIFLFLPFLLFDFIVEV
jgi:heme exporter protein B